jgi:hypothetical protein
VQLSNSNVRMNKEHLENAANNLFYIDVPKAETIVFEWD